MVASHWAAAGIGSRSARPRCPVLSKSAPATATECLDAPGVTASSRARAGGHPQGIPARGRPRRNLERHAVPISIVVPWSSSDFPAPRSRRDVGDGPAVHTGPRRQHPGAAPRSALLPHEPCRHTFGVLTWRDVDMLGLPRTTSSWRRRASTTRHVPGGPRSGPPLVVAVGRLVPVKRFDLLLRALPAKASVPGLQAAIIGEGYERSGSRGAPGAAWRRCLGAPAGPGGRRRAGVVVPTSLGGGEYIATRRLGRVTHRGSRPAVRRLIATAIAGHARRRARRRVGPLGGPENTRPEIARFSGALTRVLTDDVLRDPSVDGGLWSHSGWFTWDATARRALDALAEETNRTHLGPAADRSAAAANVHGDLRRVGSDQPGPSRCPGVDLD